MFIRFEVLPLLILKQKRLSTATFEQPFALKLIQTMFNNLGFAQFDFPSLLGSAAAFHSPFLNSTACTPPKYAFLSEIVRP